MSPVPSLVQAAETGTSSLSNVSQILGLKWGKRKGKGKTTMLPGSAGMRTGDLFTSVEAVMPLTGVSRLSYVTEGMLLRCSSQNLPLEPTNKPVAHLLI